jgi:hypothetical protein
MNSKQRKALEAKEDQGDNEEAPIIQRYGHHGHIQSKGVTKDKLP